MNGIGSKTTKFINERVVSVCTASRVSCVSEDTIYEEMYTRLSVRFDLRSESVANAQPDPSAVRRRYGRGKFETLIVRELSLVLFVHERRDEA